MFYLFKLVGILSFLFYVSFYRINAQPLCFDNLTEIPSMREEKVNLIVTEISKRLRDHTFDVENSERCLLYAIKLAQESKLGVTTVRIYDILGRIHLTEGNFAIAKSYIIRGLEVSDSIENIKCQAGMLNTLGNIESEMGNVELAIDYYLQAKNVWEIRGVKSKIIGLDINIACLYLDQKNFEKASIIFVKALQEARKLKKQKLVILCILNLGILNEKINNYDESLIFLEEILLLPKDEVIPTFRQRALILASSINLKIGQKVKAEMYFKEALPVKDSRGKMDLYINWGDGLSFSGNYYESLEKYEIAEKFAKELNDHFKLSQIYEKISAQQRSLGNFELGWKFYKLYEEINDTLINKEKQIILEKVIADFEKRGREIKIRSLERQQESDRKVKIISVALVIALIIGLVIFYSKYRYKKITTEELEKQYEKLKVQNKQIHSRELLLKESKEEIEKKNKLIAKRSRKIDQQNKELHRYNEDLEQFTYSVSHDLRAPVRSIHSFLDLIDKNIENKGVVLEYLQIARENSTLLSNLLEDLLEYTRVGRSQVALVDIDLNDIMTKVSRSLDSAIQNINAEIIVNDLPEIKGHPSDIYLLFQNLVQNSLKFRSPERKPIISISAETSENFHTIVVSDNGIGIKSDYLTKIFGVFQRVDNNKEGTGIGLAIVKKVIEHHNGELHVESVEKQGTTFYLKFPY